jgi:pimeloyl-ACP methyl ester carboxylesterase
MGAVERRATVDGDVTLAYAEQGPDGPVAAVFLPGWPDPWRSFELVMAQLPAEVRALALSHRGCGDSDRPAAGYGPRDLAADAIGFMDVTGVRSAVLVGHSLGAFVAQRIAMDHPDRVRALVLIGTFATLKGTPAAGAVAQAISEIGDPIDPAFVRRVTESSAVAGGVPEEFVEMMIGEGLKAPARVWRAGLAGLLEEDHAAELGGIRAPTVLLWGDRDGLIGRESQEAFIALVPGARLIVMPGVGHSANWEVPLEVAGVVASLVREDGS